MAPSSCSYYEHWVAPPSEEERPLRRGSGKNGALPHRGFLDRRKCRRECSDQSLIIDHVNGPPCPSCENRSEFDQPPLVCSYFIFWVIAPAVSDNFLSRLESVLINFVTRSIAICRRSDSISPISLIESSFRLRDRISAST